MPATEQTWRDLKLMHVVFGVSALIMLVGTIWMMAADHAREWKVYQRNFRDVETWSDESRIAQQENAQYEREVGEAEKALEAARREIPPAALVERFKAELDKNALDRGQKPPDFSKAQADYEALAAASPEDRPKLRDRLLQDLNHLVVRARFREDVLTSQRKILLADYDVARSKYGIAVDENAPQEELAHIQRVIDDIHAKVDRKTLEVQDAMVHRKALEGAVADMTAREAWAAKQLDETRSKLTRLVKAKQEREDSFWKELFAMPIIDAFGRPLKIEQIWLPKLTINYNFRDVPRFDRCTTCHQGIDKSAPGSAVEPAYETHHYLTLKMETPSAPPEVDEAQTPAEAAEQLKTLYGLELAPEGLLSKDDVTVLVVQPEMAAAKAGFNVGDVIQQINGVKILGRDAAYVYLLKSVKWGQPGELSVRRGLPNPYTTHPRMDLFVGSLSPHSAAQVGCTICHDGQGSATAFKFASHTPNTPLQAAAWKRDVGWYNNHNWNFPMMPKRFAESTCLKCHHDVSELEPSERFPDPPAPKLMAGYQLIRQYGCYGCHEINGFDGPTRRIGPDLRTEPNYSAAAQALLAGGNLNAQQRGWADEVIYHPEANAARHALLGSLRNPAESPAASKTENATEATPPSAVPPTDPDAIKKLAAVLEDIETPGQLRKVGPSLRHVADKLDFTFLVSWIRKPSDFRPNTKMPQFFGLDQHLGPGEGLEETNKFEPIEIRSAAEYLLAKSQPFAFAARLDNGTEAPSAERGKQLFQIRGCLACHQHRDFPGATMTQGPDLSNIGSKLNRKENPDGGKWLYSWLRNPSRYHPRTLMPNLMLDPVKAADGKTIDPAADISAYLLGSGDWQPHDVPARELTNAQRQTLFDLALEHLKAVFPKRQAEKYLREGIPESRRREIKGDEVELLGAASDQKMVNYVGRRTISKYGCSGCHDIPGFEDAKPIGTGLADWGRKGTDKLAFEQILEYITHGHGRKEIAAGATTDSNRTRAGQDKEDVEEVGEFNFFDLDPDTGYFLQALLGQQREGFIWQKLRAPRSFDYQKTQNKSYNERLRMPLFTAFDAAQREQIITFVLGLVSEPPAAQYVYRPSPRSKAYFDGLSLIDKYNCTGCHTVQMDRWKLAYSPDTFSAPPAIADYDFLEPHVTPQEKKASLQADIRGLRHATLTGMPVYSEQTGRPLRLDEDGAPIEEGDTETKAFYSIVLWKNVLINGEPRQAGLQNLLVPDSAIEKHYAPLGGFLARYNFTKVVADEKQINPNAKGDEAWGWLPPPLLHEGRKVQANWLHDFLLDPYPIRPAVLLRMPKFNMSSDEASALTNYFASVDSADHPYDFDPRTRQEYLQTLESTHPNRMRDALRIITDNNYCVKCHLIGDYDPPGSDRVKGPHLDEVYKRMRPDYVLDWIANPKRLVPYTGMPTNIPPDKPVSQSLFPGTSDEQLNGLVDFLMNYDRFMESRISIKPLIKAAAPAGASTTGQPATVPPPRTGRRGSDDRR